MGEIPIAQAFNEFKSVYMPARNYAFRTRVEYSKDVGELVDFLVKRGVSITGSISLSHLERYLAWLDEKGFAGATRKKKTVAIHTFFGFLTREGYISSDISKALITPFAEQSLPRILTRAEYTDLLAACADNPRDKAIVTVFLQTGIKLSELIRLKVSDVDIADQDGQITGQLRIEGGSGRKDRVLPLNQKACAAIREYLPVRGGTNTNILFLNRSGKALGSRGVQKTISKYMSKLGLHGFSVQTLRHTFAVQHLVKGTSLETIRNVLGHKDIRTTESYIPLAKEIARKELEENAL